MGTTVYQEPHCTFEFVQQYRRSYGCFGMASALVLPSSSLASLTVFDLDKDSANEYTESITVHGWIYGQWEDKVSMVSLPTRYLTAYYWVRRTSIAGIWVAFSQECQQI